MLRPSVLLALLLVLLAGCGGGGGTLSESEYREEFQAATQQLEVAEQLFRTPANRESQLDVLRETESRLREVADDLAALEPPASVADENEALVDAIRANAEVVGEVGEAFESDGDLQALAPRAREAVEEMVAAIAAVREALGAS